MEIKIGDYIRTKNGNIGKVIDITNIRGQNRNLYLQLVKWNKCKVYYITSFKIVKHSKNIIDLIQVGDYVNGEYVRGVHNDIETYGDKTITTKVNHRFFGSQIINIVTKEQFESIKYEVK